MGSLGGEVAKKKAMWLYPKVMGFNPPERWGHSACYSNGLLYVFGGCCGGMHFSDVLVLNLDTMTWNNLVTKGQGPGPRDSHSAVLVGHRMIVFGGTNGSKKVSDLHILDLRSSEWTRPNCKGVAPPPRESHTATLVGDDKLVIFGGSGEGIENYLSDLYILDLKTMWWTAPDVKGDIPAPRDSHSAVAIENKLFVYGGDCGDRYQGNVDMLEMDTLTWSRLAIQGPSPGVRAGHASIYVIGGVGDKQYYNDVWVLDASTCFWSQLEIRGQQPQGRFSHTAILADSDIAIYGGCGEDERPLNELLILQLGAEHPNGRYNISMCKIFGSHCNQEKRRFIQEAASNLIGAEIHGNVDGAFDSGYLMTATGPEVVHRGAILGQIHSSPSSQIAQSIPHVNHVSPVFVRHSQQPTIIHAPESSPSFRQVQASRPSPVIRTPPPPLGRDSKLQSELQGVVLTLGGPASDHGGS
ncbi:hypothetical protein RJ639_046724 [Escallonia herrerae]|uniref:Rab9 effector protein with kelch motifs n=1 Tax=Escallonia herrerae TaxID=1293975 RepID=A0AA88W802_9ASTE|nr:hypothetical protein RJ639_046724 [Escallonia herrerae]